MVISASGQVPTLCTGQEASAARRALTRLALGGYLSPDMYTHRFGTVTQESPFGTHIWHGMRALLHAWQRDGGAPSYYSTRSLRMGWFTAPGPFSRNQAEEDVRTDQYPNHTYPAVFYVDDVALVGSYTMWCEAILVRRSRSWRVHPSRVQLLDEAAWGTWLEEGDDWILL